MNTQWLFVTSLVGLAVSAAVLVLLVPSLFGPGEGAAPWLVITLAVLVAVFAAGTRHWRPPAAVTKDR